MGRHWPLLHHLWPAIVIGALLLNVFWPPYEGYAIWALSLAAYPVAAASILISRPGNRIGRVLAVVSVVAGVVFVGGWAVWTWQRHDWSLYLEAVIASGVPVLFWGVIALLYLFPGGRAPRSSFGVALLVFSACVAVMASLAPFDPDAMALTGRPNPMAGPTWIGAVYDFGLFVLVPGLGGGVWAAIARYRTAGPEMRAQMRWFMAGIVAIAALVVVVAVMPEELPSPLDQLTDVVVILGFWALPAAIVIAVRRYRLYEIDRLVSRTISYTLVVAGLAAAFFAGTTLISTVVPSQGSLAVAGSTLAVAALFDPLRRRAQRAVDRRFNRSAVHAELVMDRFAAGIRDAVDLDQVVEMWRSTIEESFQPEASAIWLAGRPASVSQPQPGL